MGRGREERSSFTREKRNNENECGTFCNGKVHRKIPETIYVPIDCVFPFGRDLSGIVITILRSL